MDYKNVLAVMMFAVMATSVAAVESNSNSNKSDWEALLSFREPIVSDPTG